MLSFELTAIVAEVARSLDRNPATFARFYDDALPKIYGYFLHRCGGSVPVAEDLTSETFLAAVRELRRGKRIDAPMPWIYGIARHKLIDHFRAEARRVRPLAEGTAPDDPEPDFTDAADNRVAAALAVVAATQRAALVLCYVDGLSAGEAAAALGRSVAAVHSLLERGRASFKRAYTEAAE
jgi:RNA polymerase sigma-70 factor (ECF subfamily)